MTLLHESRELCHFPRAMKIVLAPKAVRLHWHVLMCPWRSVDFHRNLHCKDSDCFARLAKVQPVVTLKFPLYGKEINGLTPLRNTIFMEGALACTCHVTGETALE